MLTQLVQLVTMKLVKMNKKSSLPKKDLVPGSRIPIKYLLDYIKGGYSISDFISSYPWVARKSIEKAIDEIKVRDFSAYNAL